MVSMIIADRLAMAFHLHTRKNLATFNAASRQAGISLMMVLICLVIMSLAAVGLIRMVDSGSMIVGNVAFKQSTTSASDRAAQNAITWLTSNAGGTVLYNDVPAQGYYATSLNALDPSGNSTASTRVLVNWDGAPCSGASCISPSAVDGGIDGYRVQYVITRLCKTVGDPNPASNTGQSCSRPMNDSSAASTKRGELRYGDHARFGGGTPGPFYRIVARAAGPRNTVSLTETYVYF
jgi:type IV pilus assembly protein PilX